MSKCIASQNNPWDRHCQVSTTEREEASPSDPAVVAPQSSRPFLPDEDCNGPPASRRHRVALVPPLGNFGSKTISFPGYSTTLSAQRTTRILTEASGTETPHLRFNDGCPSGFAPSLNWGVRGFKGNFEKKVSYCCPRLTFWEVFKRIASIARDV